MRDTLLGVRIKKLTERSILEKIEKFILNPMGFFHIVSLNPEIFVLLSQDTLYKKIVQEGQIKIIDGVGVAMAGRILGIDTGARVTGVDLTRALMEYANESSLRVMLIGGGKKMADRVVDCQKSRLKRIQFKSLRGISDITNPKKIEEEQIFSIVADFKPHLLFTAFGSPWQEKWIWKNQDRLNGIVCMGVGGTFDFLSGSVSRAPKTIRKLGLEWLFRLIVQPWRIRRQARLVRFIALIIKEKLMGLKQGF